MKSITNKFTIQMLQLCCLAVVTGKVYDITILLSVQEVLTHSNSKLLYKFGQDFLEKQYVLLLNIV